MFCVTALQLNAVPPKKEMEDALFVRGSVGVVADGVTRSLNQIGKYPYPSPARKAAHVVADTIGNALISFEKIQESSIRQAFVKGNAAVRELNKQLGFWSNCDYWYKDYAGAVASCFIVVHGKFHHAHIGDCGVAHLSSRGDLLWHSRDDVAAARPFFPKEDGMSKNQRMLTIRKEFRNNPSAESRTVSSGKKVETFGVLTGEDPALYYLKVESFDYEIGDTIVAYSDGIAPFIVEDEHEDFRRCLTFASEEKIRSYVSSHCTSRSYPDEKTLILART